MANAHYLNEHLHLPGIATPRTDSTIEHVYHIYTMLYDEAVVGVPRSLFQKALLAENIPCSLGYPHPLYRNPLFQESVDPDYKRLFLPAAEALCQKSLWTNVVRPPATITDMKDVVNAIEKVYTGRIELRNFQNETEKNG